MRARQAAVLRSMHQPRWQIWAGGSLHAACTQVRKASKFPSPIFLFLLPLCRPCSDAMGSWLSCEASWVPWMLSGTRCRLSWTGALRWQPHRQGRWQQTASGQRRLRGALTCGRLLCCKHWGRALQGALLLLHAQARLRLRVDSTTGLSVCRALAASEARLAAAHTRLQEQEQAGQQAAAELGAMGQHLAGMDAEYAALREEYRAVTDDLAALVKENQVSWCQLSAGLGAAW